LRGAGGVPREDADGFVPSLRNQHYQYLVNQLHKLGEGYRHNVDENLVRILGSFDDEDIRATAGYLSRLRGPGAVHPAAVCSIGIPGMDGNETDRGILDGFGAAVFACRHGEEPAPFFPVRVRPRSPATT